MTGWAADGEQLARDLTDRDGPHYFVAFAGPPHHM